MKKYFILLALLFPVVLFGKNNVQSYVDNVFSTNMFLKNSVISVYVEDEYGKEVASLNPSMPILTASVAKTITTGVALKILGPDYNFTTKIAYSGRIHKNGVLYGDVYIVGGADPTLGMNDYDMSVPADSIFAIWKEGLKAAGIKSVKGLVIGDDRIFSDECAPSFWSYGNMGGVSGCGSSGLPFGLNQSVFEIKAGEFSGDHVDVTPLTGVLPDIQIINEISTGKPGSSKNNVGCRTTRIAPVIKLYGTYPAGNTKKRIVPNQYSAWTCAYEFYKYLSANGIKTEGYDEITNVKRAHQPFTSQDSLSYVAETYSPELKDIVYITNRVSQNFFAETIYRMVGKKLIDQKKGTETLNISYKSTNKAIREYLIMNGMDLTGYSQADGSGLSRNNHISAAFLARFYNFMLQDEAVFEPYLTSFPVPGEFGTLDIVLKNENPNIKASIHAKSGSLDGVRTYAGYAKTKSGYVRFVIMVNNMPCPKAKVQPVIEGLMYEIAKYAQNM